MNVRITFEDETAFDHAISEVQARALREFASNLIDGKDPETDSRIFDPWDVADLAESRANAILSDMLGLATDVENTKKGET